MNLYRHRIASDEETRTRSLTLKLDWLGTESRPHFLCTVELQEPGKAAPESITLFMLSRCEPTPIVTSIARLGRALILEAAMDGFEAVLACVRKLAEEWRAADEFQISGRVTSMELDRINQHRRRLDYDPK